MTSTNSGPANSGMTRAVLIAYELGSTGHTKSQLTEAIMGLGEAWARPLDTVWIVRTNLLPVAIENLLLPLLGDHDGLMVQETRGEAALANTGLRWFRPRRSSALQALDNAAVLAFPANDRSFDQAA